MTYVSASPSVYGFAGSNHNGSIDKTLKYSSAGLTGNFAYFSQIDGKIQELQDRAEQINQRAEQINRNAKAEMRALDQRIAALDAKIAQLEKIKTTVPQEPVTSVSVLPVLSQLSLQNTSKNVKPDTQILAANTSPIKNNTSGLRKNFQLKISELTKAVGDKRLLNITRLHEAGHWTRDMRAIESQHHWLKQARAWVPASFTSGIALVVAALGVAGIVGGTCGIAVPVVLGVVAIGLVVFSIHRRVETWPLRDANRAFVDKVFTAKYRQNYSKVLEYTGGGSQLAQSKDEMKQHIFNHAVKSTVLELRKEGLDVKPEEINRVLNILFDQGKEFKTSLQLVKLRRILPQLVVGYRQYAKEHPGNVTGEFKTGFKAFINTKYGNNLGLGKKISYIDYINSSSAAQHLTVFKASQSQLDEYLQGKSMSHENPFAAENINNIVMLKPVHSSEAAGAETSYKVYALQELASDDKDSAGKINEQITRALVAHGETLDARQALLPLMDMIHASVFKPDSSYYNKKLSSLVEAVIPNSFEQKNQLNQMEALQLLLKKARHIDFESIYGNANYSDEMIQLLVNKDFQNLMNNHYVSWGNESHFKSNGHSHSLDRMAQLSVSEADYHLYEKTASRNIHSTAGNDLHFVGRIQWRNIVSLKQNVKVRQPAVLNKHENTLISPFYAHQYLVELDKLNIIDYQGRQNQEKSQDAARQMFADKQLQFSPSSQTDDFSEAAGIKSVDNVTFGETEANNNKSVEGALHRYENSRLLQIVYASLLKKGRNRSDQNIVPFNAVNSADIKKGYNQAQWNNDPVFKDMTHAMNMYTLNTEIRKLEAKFLDLNKSLKVYMAIKNVTSSSRVLPEDHFEDNQHDGLLDIVMRQKEIKKLSSEIADQLHSLFRTQLQLQRVYGKDSDKNEFSADQRNEMNDAFRFVLNLSQNKDLKIIFDNLHDAVQQNRNQFSLNLLNGFKGRGRLPVMKEFTFRPSFRKLLGDDINAGISRFKNTLDDITQQRAGLEDWLYSRQTQGSSNTFEDMEYLQGLVL